MYYFIFGKSSVFTITVVLAILLGINTISADETLSEVDHEILTNSITKEKPMCPFYPVTPAGTKLFNCKALRFSKYYNYKTTRALAMAQTSVKKDIYVPPDINNMTADARNWYLTGVSNAERHLNFFERISREITEGKEIKESYKTELGALLPQIQDANENTKALVPTLGDFVNRLYGWTRKLSFLDKIKIKAALYYVNGKRDNKSYYLLNGGALWCKLRVDKFLTPISSNPTASSLITDLNKFEDQILVARDSLDDAAQEYVKGIGKLATLVGDIGQNADEIRTVVNTMKSELDSRRNGILETSATAVKSIKDKIKKL